MATKASQLIAEPRVCELLKRDASIYRQKAMDYAPDPGGPWENFEYAARFVGGVTKKDVTREDIALALVGVKLSRLATVGLAREAKNEAVADTLGDLRVYLAILEAMLEESV